MYAHSFPRRPDEYTPEGHRELVGTLLNLNIESSTDLIVDLAHERRH